MGKHSTQLDGLAGLDQEVRQLFREMLKDTTIVNRFLLEGAIASFRGIVQDQLCDLLEVYEDEITIKDAAHPGVRIFPTLQEHMVQLAIFYAEILDNLFDALRLDVMAGIASVDTTPDYSDVFKILVSIPQEWQSWSTLTAAWDGVQWTYLNNHLSKITTIDGDTFATVIDGLDCD